MPFRRSPAGVSVIEELQRALRSVPVAHLEGFAEFCARQWRRNSPPGGATWHAMAGVVEEALDDVRAEIEHLERALDDEGGMGAIVPGV